MAIYGRSISNPPGRAARSDHGAAYLNYVGKRRLTASPEIAANHDQCGKHNDHAERRQ
jgi:hypothetical protein